MTLLLAMRWMAIFVSGLVIGYAAVVASLFIRRRRPDLKRRTHVALIALSYIGFVVVGFLCVFESILHSESFHVWQSPLTLLASALGFIALTGYLPSERNGGP